MIKIERKWKDILEPVRKKSSGMDFSGFWFFFIFFSPVLLEMTLSGMDRAAPEASGHIKG